MISLLLHLNESSPLVVDACKVTLKQLGPLLGSAGVKTYVLLRHMPLCMCIYFFMYLFTFLSVHVCVFGRCRMLSVVSAAAITALLDPNAVCGCCDNFGRRRQWC